MCNQHTLRKGEPIILVDEEMGIVQFLGESYPEYTDEVFQPVFQWLRQHTLQSGKSLLLVFQMTYFNTSTSKRIWEMLKIASKYHEMGKGKVLVQWYYEPHDQDMYCSGCEYSNEFDELPIEFIAC
jgi:hypothetical protein